jgi:hypothetical protein
LATLRTRVASLENQTKVLDGIQEGETVVGLINTAKTTLEASIATVDTAAQQGITDAAAAKKYAEDNIGTLNTRVTSVEGAVDLLNESKDHEGSVDYKIYQAVADILNNDDTDINSL